MCPLCNERPVIVAACTPCWVRTKSGFQTTVEDRARLALFERSSMTPGHRQLFNELKARWMR
jgi:hypothetical protein